MKMTAQDRRDQLAAMYRINAKREWRRAQQRVDRVVFAVYGAYAPLVKLGATK